MSEEKTHKYNAHGEVTDRWRTECLWEHRGSRINRSVENGVSMWRPHSHRLYTSKNEMIRRGSL